MSNHSIDLDNLSSSVSSLKRRWETPTLTSLDARETETTATKWFTPDNHFISSDYGTPATKPPAS
jgi:hypothetical protein